MLTCTELVSVTAYDRYAGTGDRPYIARSAGNRSNRVRNSGGTANRVRAGHQTRVVGLTVRTGTLMQAGYRCRRWSGLRR